jgi:transposase
MSAPFRPYEPDQILLFPPNAHDWLPKDHLAYFLLDVVRELDLGRIYAYYDMKPLLDPQGKVIGVEAKSGRGYPGYDPRMMVGILLYGYVTGAVSSRQIQRKCVEDVAFRVIAGNQAPDHDTIANFRKVHLGSLKALFLDVLQLCQKAGLVRLGHVALDGTKVKANASKHKAMSYGHMVKRERELQQEIDEILKRADEADEAEDQRYGKGKRGDELPEELARRESRLSKIREAKAALEAEAKAAADAKRQQEEEDRKKRDRDGDPPRQGKPPEISETPEDKAQRNFTDPESRIMKNSDKAFIQGYNAQAAVDHHNQVIVAADVSRMAPDAPHLKPMVAQIKENLRRVPEELSADAGYFSEENVKELHKRHIDPLIAAERKKHGERPPSPRGRIPKDATLKERMIRKLRTVAGRAAYALRKVTVEPVFGQIRTQGLVRFWLRGLENAKAEWSLWCTGHNLLKLYRALAGS